MILEILAQKDKYWRSVALGICKDTELADDLVQDMYLRMYNIWNLKDINVNEYYVIRIMINLYLDYVKENKVKVSIENYKELEEINEAFELDDKDIRIINRLSDDHKELLMLKVNNSYREIAKIKNTCYVDVYRTIKKLKDKYGKKK